MNMVSEYEIAVIGLGYVGLPLAVELGKKYRTIGFDVNKERIEELKKGYDCTQEVLSEDLEQAEKISFSSDQDSLKKCNIFIVCVPTPVDEHNSPDFSNIITASELVGKNLSVGDIVIYESTVYPGATEEVCVPVLQNFSDLKFNQDFFCGYSPERINPGDKERGITKIKKVTSGSTPEIATKIDELYKSIITAGTHKAESIKVAEAAKVIENTQRDLNIALINELAILFNKLGIDTQAVLEAAGTKWNFLRFSPGLVGGHCIGVDPYYLTHKSTEVGYYPEIILSGRRLNDNMGKYVAGEIAKLMTRKRIHVFDANVLILGLTFKENCPDLRNTRVVDLIQEFQDYNCHVDVYDPWVDKEEAQRECGITPIETLKEGAYDAVVLAVAHDEFKLMDVSSIRALGKSNCVLYDIKYVLSKDEVDGRL
jgi:UDP-N-acetyl-D-galactosamine dehydrogenase